MDFERAGQVEEYRTMALRMPPALHSQINKYQVDPASAGSGIPPLPQSGWHKVRQ
jgi:hypothetical protein